MKYFPFSLFNLKKQLKSDLFLILISLSLISSIIKSPLQVEVFASTKTLSKFIDIS